jgi:hypothetical protein
MRRSRRTLRKLDGELVAGRHGYRQGLHHSAHEVGQALQAVAVAVVVVTPGGQFDQIFHGAALRVGARDELTEAVHRARDVEAVPRTEATARHRIPAAAGTSSGGAGCERTSVGSSSSYVGRALGTGAAITCGLPSSPASVRTIASIDAAIVSMTIARSEASLMQPARRLADLACMRMLSRISVSVVICMGPFLHADNAMCGGSMLSLQRVK